VGLTAPAARAEQRLYRVEEADKMPLLLELLRGTEGRVLIFTRTKRKVERVARTVSGRFSGVARLHGDREQSQRDTAMNGFRSGACRILIATDIAARGIDVADIEHVVNYDFPGSPEDYIHRIGRTARVAAAGVAISFVTATDKPVLKRLEKLIGSALPMLRRGGGHEPEEKGHPAHGRTGSAGGAGGPAHGRTPGRVGASEPGRSQGAHLPGWAPSGEGRGLSESARRRRRRRNRRDGARGAGAGQPMSGLLPPSGETIPIIQ